jgi:hypothetical protein
MEDDEPKTVWGLLVACAGAALITLFELPGAIRDCAPYYRHAEWAAMAGAITVLALIGAVIPWAILYFAYLRRRASANGPAYFLILYVLCFALDAGAIALVMQAGQANDAQMRIASQEVVRAMTTVMNTKDGQIDMTIKATGEAGEVERVSKTLLAQFVARKAAYQAQMETLGIRTIMLPSNLAADRGLVHTRARLKAARAVLKDYSQVLESMRVDMHAQIAVAKLSDEMKKGMLSGIDSTMAQEQGDWEAEIRNEDDILSEFQEMTDTLAHPRGRWTVKGNVVEFTNGADLAAYRKHVDAVHAYQAQERVVIAGIRARAEQLIATPPQ